MNFLFFISFLAVATATSVTLPLKKLLGNPKLFASAFAHADQDAIAKMRDLINQLLVEEAEAKQLAITFHEDMTAAHGADVEALNGAIAALDEASYNLDVATSARNTLIDTEESHRTALVAAQVALNDAENLDTVLLAHSESTTARVAAEKELLDQVLPLLESVKSEGRRLLSIDNADPGAVDAVIAKVHELLEAGVAEDAAAAAASEEAHNQYVSALAVRDDAQVLHTDTAGQLAAAENSVKSLTSVKAARTSDFDSATSAEKASSETLAAAQKNMDSEIARVDSETATLNEVDDLLEGLQG